MTREIKVKVTLETEETLTEDEVNAIKKSLSGQMIKTLNADGIKTLGDVDEGIKTLGDVVKTLGENIRGR